MELKNQGHHKKRLLFISLFFVIAIFGYLPEGASKQSPVRVAFFKGFDYKNRQIELMAGGQFYHVAIQIEGQWYHASTLRGVESFKSLLSIPEEGVKVHSVLESKEWSLSKKDIGPYLGLEFDYFYEWENTNKTDCTKYIAQLLDVSPTRTDFSSDHWRVSYGITEGGLGVSPDELYSRLKLKGFYNVSPRLHLNSSEDPIVGETTFQCRGLLD